MAPRIAARINQHTLWQALTKQLPPLKLPPSPIASATLDSRDVEPGDLFIALVGRYTDGHSFIEETIRNGTRAILCEARGRDAARAAGAVVVDCTASNRAGLSEISIENHGAPLAFVVDDCEAALQAVGGFQRTHRTDPTLRVIGITGSVGKTSTKELCAAVLSQRYATLHSPDSLNNEQGMPLTLIGLGYEEQRAVLEMGMYDIGEIRDLCRLARPHVGVITNVGPSHLSRLGTMARITQAKTELVEALPAAEDGGVAILNWDDERVRSMADKTSARIFRYGLTDDADLWADEIESAGLEGIRFRFHHQAEPGSRVESLHLRVPLLGRHSVHTALRATAVGLVEGLSWEEIIAGLQNMPGQLRLVVVAGINKSTVIDDTYNASPASTTAALNLLADLQPDDTGRKVAVLGDMLELGNYAEEGHKLVGRRAAGVVDVLVTVGDLGGAIGREAVSAGLPANNHHATEDADAAIALLRRELGPSDLVLVKGSRAVGMEHILDEITLDENQPGKGEA